jgi:hypothetical protein|tara:strand:+ start:47 stop:361 length:315 start_codon:yes stop_codon:yes gene_type:complete
MFLHEKKLQTFSCLLFKFIISVVQVWTKVIQNFLSELILLIQTWSFVKKKYQKRTTYPKNKFSDIWRKLTRKKEDKEKTMKNHKLALKNNPPKNQISRLEGLGK